MDPKWPILITLYIGYAAHTYSRRAFQNIINYVLKEKFLTQEKIGFIVTCQQMSYTFSKICHPFIIDRIEPTFFFSLAMFIPSICLQIFAYSKDWKTMASFYSIEGFFLSFAWPSLAKLLKAMIDSSEFGLWWAILCTSSNVGSIVGSMASALISDHFGWRISIKTCSFICFGIGVLTVICFKTFEVPRNTPIVSRDSRNSQYSVKDSLPLTDFIFNPILVSNGILFFAVYLSRYLISDWYQVHLYEMKFTQITIAKFLSAVEIGGTIGSIFAGITADFCLINFQRSKNPRLFVLIFCGICITILKYLLVFLVKAHTSKIVLMVLGFLYGFFLFGPVSVSGVIAIEAAPVDKQGLCFAINVLYANFAMLTAGYPVSYLSSRVGWEHIFSFSIAFIALATLLLFLVRNKNCPIDNIEEPHLKSARLTYSQSLTEWRMRNEDISSV